MGGSFSAFNKFGLPGLSTATTKQVYDRHFKEKKTAEFKDFHIAYVEFCKYFNTVMPGRDFDTPSRQKIEKFYKDWWEGKDENTRRTKFFEFMEEHVKEAKVDQTLFIVAGVAAPVAAVVGKRASGHVPYVKSLRLDLVPDVVFVPFVTLLGIMTASAWQMSSRSAAAAREEEAAKEEEQQRKDKS